MSKYYHDRAKRIVILQIGLLPFTIFIYLWLKNVLIGFYFILFIVIIVSWIITLFISVILLKKSKILEISEN